MLKVDILVGVGFRGGVEAVINRTAKYLNDNDCHVRIVNLLWIGTKWADESLEFAYLFDTIKEQWNKDYDLLAKRYEEYVEKNGAPDIILATGWPLICHLARQVSDKLDNRPPVVSWLHGVVEAYIEGDLGGYKELSEADAHLAINAKIAEKIAKNTGSDAIYRITNPIDPRKIVYSENRNTYKLAFVGRLDYEKNIPYLLSVLSKADRAWELMVVGDGDPEGNSMNALKGFCRDLGIEKRVHFLGWLERPWEALQDCRALVLPSLHEASPLVAIEALLCGMFIISTPTEGMLEKVRPGENGYLVPIGDEAFFVNVLNYLKEGKLPSMEPKACRDPLEYMLGDTVLEEFRRDLEIILDAGNK